MLAIRLAEYTQALEFKDLPADVVHEVKRRVLDSFACAFGGLRAKPCRIAERVCRAVAQSDGATLWGTTHKAPPELATFANGTLVRYLDFNDTYLSKEPAHPSDNIPAALAVGELTHASGKRLILAIAIAYEVQCRLCDAAALRPRGWDHVTYGAFSSALAAAKLLRLSPQATAHALGLAGVGAPALRQTRVGELSMWKACAFANSARNGVFAALLARQGMTGPAPIFEGDKGFMKVVSGEFALPALGGERGTSFKILDTYIKHYPVEYHAQSAVEAALHIRKQILEQEGRAGLDGITAIEAGSFGVAIEIIGREPEKWHPRTRETADHSLPYCVAVALMDGAVTVRSFSPRRIADKALQDLIQKVEVVEVPEFTDWYPAAMPTRLRVRTAAGREYVKQVDFPLGHPRNPLSDREVEMKLRRLANGKLDTKRIGRLIEQVWELDTMKEIGALPHLMVAR